MAENSSEPLTPDEQELYVAAVFELVQAGKPEAAESLGQLAATDPDQLRKILKGGDADTDPSPEFQQ